MCEGLLTHPVHKNRSLSVLTVVLLSVLQVSRNQRAEHEVQLHLRRSVPHADRTGRAGSGAQDVPRDCASLHDANAARGRSVDHEDERMAAASSGRGAASDYRECLMTEFDCMRIYFIFVSFSICATCTVH
jgi:hypothetical protein